jgi:hypothetical protein
MPVSALGVIAAVAFTLPAAAGTDEMCRMTGLSVHIAQSSKVGARPAKGDGAAGRERADGIRRPIETGDGQAKAQIEGGDPKNRSGKP